MNQLCGSLSAFHDPVTSAILRVLFPYESISAIEDGGHMQEFKDGVVVALVARSGGSLRADSVVDVTVVSSSNSNIGVHVDVAFALNSIEDVDSQVITTAATIQSASALLVMGAGPSPFIGISATYVDQTPEKLGEWLGNPNTAVECMTRILAANTTRHCSHQYFHYALSTDKSCGCVYAGTDCRNRALRTPANSVVGYAGTDLFTITFTAQPAWTGPVVVDTTVSPTSSFPTSSTSATAQSSVAQTTARTTGVQSFSTPIPTTAERTSLPPTLAPTSVARDSGSSTQSTSSMVTTDTEADTELLEPASAAGTASSDDDTNPWAYMLPISLVLVAAIFGGVYAYRLRLQREAQKASAAMVTSSVYAVQESQQDSKTSSELGDSVISAESSIPSAPKSSGPATTAAPTVRQHVSGLQEVDTSVDDIAARETAFEAMFRGFDPAPSMQNFDDKTPSTLTRIDNRDILLNQVARARANWAASGSNSGYATLLPNPAFRTPSAAYTVEAHGMYPNVPNMYDVRSSSPSGRHRE